IQGATSGFPMFPNTRAFIDTIQGRGQLGTAITALSAFGGGAFRPITLTAPQARDLEAAITTESKVFSVYAEAAVGQGHSRIHAVIDMRPQPTITSVCLRGLTESGVTTSSTMSRSGTAGVGQLTTQSGATQTVSSQGGTIVYWRED